MKDKRILIGCPTSNHKYYALKQYIGAIKTLTYNNCGVLLVDNSKTNAYYNLIKKDMPVIKGKYFESARERIVESRNILREKTLKGDYDYFLSLEQDVIPPRNIIERLMSYNKNIVTGVYFGYDNENNLLPLLYAKVKGDEVRNLTFDEVKEPKLIEVDACGLGCVLISRKVLKKVKFRFDPNSPAFDDIWFSVDATKAGFKIYCDTSVKCKHLIKGRWNWGDIQK